jgi:hypothetical protein
VLKEVPKPPVSAKRILLEVVRLGELIDLSKVRKRPLRDDELISVRFEV